MAISRLQVFYDLGQRSAVVMQMFETAADMAESARIFDATDVSETPRTLASVDTCELVLHVTSSD